MNKIVNISKNAKQTQDIAQNLILDLVPNNVICLYGDLGSGKTTFVQGLAKALGIKKAIISPTFVLVRKHKLKVKIPFGEGMNNYIGWNFEYFYHIDLYRLSQQKDIENLGLGEIINDPQNIVAIEWAEKMGSLLPEKRIDIRFENLGQDNRRIILEVLSES